VVEGKGKVKVGRMRKKEPKRREKKVEERKIVARGEGRSSPSSFRTWLCLWSGIAPLRWA